MLHGATRIKITHEPPQGKFTGNLRHGSTLLEIIQKPFSLRIFLYKQDFNMFFGTTKIEVEVNLDGTTCWNVATKNTQPIIWQNKWMCMCVAVALLKETVTKRKEEEQWKEKRKNLEERKYMSMLRYIGTLSVDFINQIAWKWLNGNV